MGATFLGWLLPFLMGYTVMRVMMPGNSTAWIVIGLSLIGVLIALPQWWVLRRRGLHASWWVLASGLGRGTVGLLDLVTSELFPILLGIAVLPAVATSVACWQLLDRQQKYDLMRFASSHGA